MARFQRGDDFELIPLENDDISVHTSNTLEGQSDKFSLFQFLQKHKRFFTIACAIGFSLMLIAIVAFAIINNENQIVPARNTTRNCSLDSFFFGKVANVLESPAGAQIFLAEDYCRPLMAFEPTKLIGRQLVTFCTQKSTPFNNWQLTSRPSANGELRPTASGNSQNPLCLSRANTSFVSIEFCNQIDESVKKFKIAIERISNDFPRVYFSLRNFQDYTKCIGLNKDLFPHEHEYFQMQNCLFNKKMFFYLKQVDFSKEIAEYKKCIVK